MSFIPSAAVNDGTLFTELTSPVTAIGGEFNDASAALTAGQTGGARVTPGRALHANLRNQAGTEIGTAASPVFVQDATAETSLASIVAAIVAGKLQSQPFVQFSGGLLEQPVVANRIYYGSLSATPGAAVITGAPGYCIQSISVALDPLATVATAGTKLITFTDSSTGSLLTIPIWIPAAAPTFTTPQIIKFETPPGFFWNNQAANSSLTISMPTLATGVAYVTINYAQTSWVG